MQKQTEHSLISKLRATVTYRKSVYCTYMMLSESGQWTEEKHVDGNDDKTSILLTLPTTAC